MFPISFLERARRFSDYSKLLAAAGGINSCWWLMAVKYHRLNVPVLPVFSIEPVVRVSL